MMLQPENKAKIEADRRFARYCLSGFIWDTFQEYKMGWVHEEICHKLDIFLQQVFNKERPRLMLMMPPRHGKTEIVSRRFPAYALGRNPNLSIIATSYSAELSSRNNLDVQRIMDTEEYRTLFPDAKLPRPGIRNDGRFKRTSDIFEIVDKRGSYRSAGVGGGITGMGADILIIDDPIKDRVEADSSTNREKVYSWYTDVARTRLEPGGGVLVIMTRWHSDDLCGRLLTMDKDAWEVIEYPAIATRDEAHRKEGEALHPERYPLEELLDIKKDAGSRGWEALYQQRPVIDGGAIFKKEWLKYYTSLPAKFDRMIMSWDLAFKDADDSDFVVGQIWGRKGANCYLLDQVRGRLSFTESLSAVIKLSQKWPKAMRKLIEDKANGPAVIDTLKNNVQGIIPINPDGSKTARAYAVTPLFEAGNVYLPAPGMVPWLDDYVNELLIFPAGAHDDQVDATTQALRDLSKRNRMKFNPLNLLPH